MFRSTGHMLESGRLSPNRTGVQFRSSVSALTLRVKACPDDTRRLSRVMPKLRATACIFASAAIAMILSVGAALAAGPPVHEDTAAGKAKPPPGLCILHDIGIKK